MEKFTLKQILKKLEKEICKRRNVYYKENLYCEYDYLISECEEKENEPDHIFNQKIWEYGSMDLRINIFGESILVYRLGYSNEAKEEIRIEEEEEQKRLKTRDEGI